MAKQKGGLTLEFPSGQVFAIFEKKVDRGNFHEAAIIRDYWGYFFAHLFMYMDNSKSSVTEMKASFFY